MPESMCAEIPMFLILANSLRSEEKYLSGDANDQADFRRRGFRNFIITELKFMLGHFNFEATEQLCFVLLKQVCS